MSADRPVAVHAPDADAVIAATSAWVERAVIGLNLCPFAKAVVVRDALRITVSAATTPQALVDDLVTELELLQAADPAVLETTLLIHPAVLADFLDYNDFLDVADSAVQALGLDDALLVASFHPDYVFEGNPADAIDNATNRSPHPMLHLLRHASLDRAVAAIPDPASIWRENVRRLRALGPEGLRAVLAGPSPGA